MWGSVVAAILEYMEGGGSGTARSIADAIDKPPLSVRRVLLRMADAPRHKRRVHVSRWTYEGSDLEEAHLRSVYIFGPGNNAPRPGPRPRKDVCRDSARRAHAMLAPVYPGITQKAAIKLRSRINKARQGDQDVHGLL